MTESFLRRTARKLLYWRFLLLYRKRHNQLVLERVSGRPFLILPGVFNPALFFSSELLVNAIQAKPFPSGSSVLDLGTGSGIAAIFAAGLGAQVIGVDTNPDAILCARINAELNRLADRCEFRLGNLFEPVKGFRFDLIVFNPPYFKGIPESQIEQSFYSPDIIPQFLLQVARYLNPGGLALVVLSSDSDLTQYQRALAENTLEDKAIRKRNILGETIWVREIFPVGLRYEA